MAAPRLAQIASVLDGDLGLTGEEAIGVRHRPQGARSSRCAGSRRTPATTATSWWARSRELGWGHGLDADTDEYVDLAAAGIIDPVKVTRNAVSNAVSIAGLLLTTESLVVEKPAEPEPAAAGGHGHSHGGHGHQHGPGF